jgi:CRP/FNR family transcriptional regulator, cyclic AMP receptor protein
MQQRDDRLDPTRLDGMPLFADLSDKERMRVAACMRDVAVEAGTMLGTEGENAYQLFAIEAGEAEVRKGGEHIRMLRAGDFFGEIGMLATGTRTASVIARTPMRLVAMFSRDFKQIERQMPSLAEALRKTMRERVARTSF